VCSRVTGQRALWEVRDAGAEAGGLVHLPGNPAGVLLDVRADRELAGSHLQDRHHPILAAAERAAEAISGHGQDSRNTTNRSTPRQPWLKATPAHFVLIGG